MKMIFRPACFIFFMFCLGVQASPELCPSRTVTLPLYSQTSLGFSGNELLSNIATPRPTSIRWGDGKTSTAYFEFLPSNDFAKVVTYEGNNCVIYESQVYIDGFLLMRTNDGQITARWATTISANSISKAEIELNLEGDELQGLPGPADWEFVPRTYLRFKFQSSGIDGVIYRIFGIPHGDCHEGSGCSFTSGDALIATIGNGVPWFSPMSLK
jgi:hypothetical protein